MAILTIGFDVDGVILDLCGSIKEYLKKDGIYIDSSQIKNYNFSDQKYRQDIFRCFDKPEIFLSAKPYPDMAAIIRLLNMTSIAYYFETFSVCEEVFQAKVQWFKNKFPFVLNQQIIHRKSENDKEYENADVVVEDNPGYLNTETFINGNHIVAMPNRPYNQNVRHPKAKRFHNISEFLNIIMPIFINNHLKTV